MSHILLLCILFFMPLFFTNRFIERRWSRLYPASFFFCISAAPIYRMLRRTLTRFAVVIWLGLKASYIRRISPGRFRSRSSVVGWSTCPTSHRPIALSSSIWRSSTSTRDFASPSTRTTSPRPWTSGRPW